MDWYPAWLTVREVLDAVHQVSAAQAVGSSRVNELLGQLGRTVAPDARGAAGTGVGSSAYVVVTEALGQLRPEVPVDRDDHDALVRLLWWCWSCLGLSRQELTRVVEDPRFVRVAERSRLSTAALDRLLWRSGTTPPVRGTAAVGLARIADRVGGALDHVSEQRSAERGTTWQASAIERLRVLEPGVRALAGMLACLAAEPVDLTPVVECATRLAPVALADAVADQRVLRRTVSQLAGVGLVAHEGLRVELAPGARDVVRDALSEPERRFAARAAVGLMENLYPGHTYRAETWKDAARLRNHARAATAANEAMRSGDGWSSALLERLCIFDFSQGRFEDAALAGERALRAAERQRVDDESLADILVNYALALGALERTDDAEAMFQRALDLTEREPEERAKTLNLFADLLRTTDRPGEAIAHQHAALALLGTDHQQTRADILHDLSLAYSGLRRYREALSVLQEAASVVQSQAETAVLIETRIVRTLADLGDHDAALERGERLLDRVRATWGERSWPYVSALHARGVALDGRAGLTGRVSDRRHAEKAYRSYRALREALEASPEDAPGTSGPV